MLSDLPIRLARAAFNKALAEADNEPASGAITSRKAKTAEAETEAAEEAEAVVEAPAEEA